MDSKQLISGRLADHRKVLELLMADEATLAAAASAARTMADCFRRGGRVYFCGNGGSAADAQHLAAEFSGKFYKDRPSLPAEALHCNTSFLTAVANDYAFEKVYSRLVSGVGREGDVLVGISTSGHSVNIVEAFTEGRRIGMTTVAFTGAGGGAMAQLADILIAVPSTDTPRIQEMHITLGHALCEWVEAELF